MKNIELKVTLENFKNILLLLKKIKAKHKGMMHQIDTYYQFKDARIKIREIDKKIFELIIYQRPNSRGSKISNYRVYKLKGSALKNLKNNLKAKLGEKIIVSKKRNLYLYKNTRIHLDNVKGLGKFLELETVVNKPNLPEARKEHNFIKKVLLLNDYKNIHNSYSDILYNS